MHTLPKVAHAHHAALLPIVDGIVGLAEELEAPAADFRSRLAEEYRLITRGIGAGRLPATILFADVVDFTPLSERLPAAQVVEILDHLFTHFDTLAERYDLEKIKTIGDCYMVAAGVPTPRPDHAQAIARMALDMREAMRSQDEVGHLGLELRIGINSGPVVAGVIGRKRFLYDLWGDAVNTVSRMESHGTPGQIQVTRATHDLLEREFVLERRGTVPVKGKGEVETWYLVRRRDAGELHAAATKLDSEAGGVRGGLDPAASRRPTRVVRGQPGAADPPDRVPSSNHAEVPAADGTRRVAGGP